MGDNYKKGCPDGLILEDLVKKLKEKEIGYTCIKLNDLCDKMFQIMKDVYPEMEVHDLTDDIKLKTPE